MIGTVSFVPLGVGASLSPYVARAVEVIRESGLEHEFHSMGTNVQGSFEEIVAVVKACDEALIAMGVPRVLIRLSLDDRRDKPASMQAKRDSVQGKLSG